MNANAENKNRYRLFESGQLCRGNLFRMRAALTVVSLVLTVAAANAQTFNTVFTFDDIPHGAQPTGSLAQGRDGNLYGTTYGGGGPNYNRLGLAFRLAPSGHLTILHDFGRSGSGLADGYSPQGGVTLGTDMNFYGTTQYFVGCAEDCGSFFKIDSSGTLTTLYDFAGGSLGEMPFGPPTQGTDGNFYGTASGIAFKITPSGSFTALNSLSNAVLTPLLLGTDGFFYGIFSGEKVTSAPAAFRMSPSGVATIFYTFGLESGQNTSGLGPMIQGNDGNFYGVIPTDNSATSIAYKLTPQGAFTALHNFAGPPSDGSGPYGALLQGSDGNFYGVTQYGGTSGTSGNFQSGYGVIYRLTPTGGYSVLYNFTASQGQDPAGIFQNWLMQHTNGLIYGMSLGSNGGSNFGSVYSLNVGLTPFVKLVTSQGKVGKIVELIGQGLSGTTSVFFNGTPATFTNTGDAELVTTVPEGATTGYVEVTTTGSGTLQSNRYFDVTPVITTFLPASGAAGTPVTITGNSLTQTTQVAFGSVPATSFTVVSDTEVIATVPTGALSGVIAITTAGGKTWSTTNFTVSP
jgi:uncharacterized repeat protein (TIGR03803 family)